MAIPYATNPYPTKGKPTKPWFEFLASVSLFLPVSKEEVGFNFRKSGFSFCFQLCLREGFGVFLPPLNNDFRNLPFWKTIACDTHLWDPIGALRKGPENNFDNPTPQIRKNMFPKICHKMMSHMA